MQMVAAISLRISFFPFFLPNRPRTLSRKVNWILALLPLAPSLTPPFFGCAAADFVHVGDNASHKYHLARREPARHYCNQAQPTDA